MTEGVNATFRGTQKIDMNKLFLMTFIARARSADQAFLRIIHVAKIKFYFSSPVRNDEIALCIAI